MQTKGHVTLCKGVFMFSPRAARPGEAMDRLRPRGRDSAAANQIRT